MEGLKYRVFFSVINYQFLITGKLSFVNTAYMWTPLHSSSALLFSSFQLNSIFLLFPIHHFSTSWSPEQYWHPQRLHYFSYFLDTFFHNTFFHNLIVCSSLNSLGDVRKITLLDQSSSSFVLLSSLSQFQQLEFSFFNDNFSSFFLIFWHKISTLCRLVFI